MLANLKNFKQAVLLNLDEDNQVHFISGVPNPFYDQESNSVDLESLSNDSDKKMFRVRKNRSNSSRKLRGLVHLKSTRSNSNGKVRSVSHDEDSEDRNSFDGLQNLVIDLSDNSSHRQQIARVNHSEDTESREDSLMNLSDDGYMQAYCRSLGYATDNCRKWAGYSAKSPSTNIASAKSDSDNDNKSTSSFTDSDDSRSGDTSSNSALSEYLMQLNMFSKMGNGIKFMEKKAKKARDVGLKYAPMADQAFAIVAPENHAKYAPKVSEGYKAFNTNANKYGGWSTVDKAAEAMQGMGLIQLKSKKSQKQILCDKLERTAHGNPLFIAKSAKGIAYRTNLQAKIDKLECYV
jgi:hypothetical protein